MIDLDNLKEMRLKKKLTQTELAKLIGVTMTTVARWEQGANAASNENMIKLTELFSQKE